MVKNLLAVQKTWVRFLDWEDPLGKGKATHSSILAGEFHRQRSLAGYSPQGHRESDTMEQLSTHSLPQKRKTVNEHRALSRLSVYGEEDALVVKNKMHR